MLAVFVLAACESPNGPDPHCKVKFETNGGSSVDTQTIISGNTAVRPESPVKTGYTFVNWYADAGLTTVYDFKKSVKDNITLYAQWNANQYTVSFYTNGGSSAAAQTISHGGTVSQPADPVRDGYYFIGWYSDITLNTPYNFAAPVTAAITLYAGWSDGVPTALTVTFESNGGGPVATQTINSGFTVSRPANPTRSGYYFIDWYGDITLNTPYDFTAPVTRSITLYAKWSIVSPTTFTVTFESNGGSAVAAQTVNYGSTVSYLDSPTRDGYTFAGWYRDITLNSEYYFYDSVIKNITLYAKWNINQYTVSFNNQWGNPVDSQVIVEGSTVSRPDDPVRNGYIFAGWLGYNGDMYDFSSPVYENIYLYAMWRCTVTFESNGGSAVAAQTPFFEGAPSRPADPTRDGYTFAGWYGDINFTWQYNFNTAIIGNITLYAKWSTAAPTTVTVTFESNGGSWVAAQTVNYNSTASRPDDPTRDGYTFAGWYGDITLNWEYYFGNSVYENITLYAKWNIYQYTITFESNGGSAVSAQPVNSGSMAIRPYNPIRDGYTFAGWHSDITLNWEYNFANSVYENITLYAKWSINQYTVTFETYMGGWVPPQTINYGSTVVRPNDPTKNNSIFIDWYSDYTRTTLYNFSTPVTYHITLYAMWGRTVTFDTDGGSAVAAQVVNEGSTATRPDNPTKDNGTFVDWYSDYSLTKLYNFSTPVTDNITLYSKWGNFSLPLTNVTDVRHYLSEQSATVNNPVPLSINIQLTEANWKGLISRISKYVNLDLSQCTRSADSTGGGLRSDGTFDPIPSYNNGKSGIVSIILPNTATAIISNNDSITHNTAFQYFSNLKFIRGDSIATIGARAFGDSITFNQNIRTSLTNVDFPQATTIGYYAFSGCTGLTSINFPKVTVIGSAAFAGCTGLTSVSFPQLSIIVYETFDGCTSLTNVNFPLVYSIERDAFRGCTGLTSVSFPGATSISGFSGCTGLTSIDFPYATYIVDNAFSGCTGLTSVSFPFVISIHHYSNYPVNGAFSGCTGLTSVNIPQATTIGDYAFYGCTGLTSVDFPQAATIYQKAFQGCTDLTSINFPKVTAIGSTAFAGCTGLTSVSFPQTTAVYEFAFSGCTSLTSVSLPQVTTVDSLVFRECTGLTSVSLPQVTTIGSSAFFKTGNASLTITMGTTAPKLGTTMFNEIYSTKNVTVRIPAGATGYGASEYNKPNNNWGNGFRGKGWDGTKCLLDDMNSNINLVIQTYQP